VSIYHLHIPRTSGVYIRNNIVPHLISKNIPHFASNRTKIDVEHIAKSKFVIGHFGRMPLEYMDFPKVFCLIRDPIERYISYFKYTTGSVTSEKAAKENLEQWLYGPQSAIQSNLQSKFLTGSTNVEEFNRHIGNSDAYIDNAWHLENYKLDIGNIQDLIKNINIYTLDNHEKFKNNFNEELQNQFGIKIFKYNDKANEAPRIKISIDKAHIKRIKELNEIDYEVYNYVKSNEKR
jgi:hypothetical protein